jgi:hypothetical protein
VTGVHNQPSSQLTTADAEAIRYLEQAITGGKHWYIALLETMALWDTPEEIHNGRIYRYLIDGEAFDWLLLAERLCSAVDGLLPPDEKFDLLFHGRPPLDMTKERFKELIGGTRHHQYLNYFYGITVEEALVLAVQDEVRKERRSSGYAKERDTTIEVYRRIYGASRGILLRNFRHEKGYPNIRSTSLLELKEFTYWLFRYRLKHCDKARVASDTKKALDWLNNHGFPKGMINSRPLTFIDSE